MTYAPGTLVRIKDIATDDGAYHSDSNRSLVRDHGYLWIVEDHDVGAGWYYCKSVASGESTVMWLPNEIEGANNHE